MNYRLLLTEMLTDYTERMSTEKNADKRAVYKEVINDLLTALSIEPNQISLMNEVQDIIGFNEE